MVLNIQRINLYGGRKKYTFKFRFIVEMVGLEI